LMDTANIILHMRSQRATYKAIGKLPGLTAGRVSQLYKENWFRDIDVAAAKYETQALRILVAEVDRVNPGQKPWTKRLTGNAVAGNLLERYEQTGDLAIASAITELISVRMGSVPPEPKRVTDLLGDLLERIQTKC